MLRYTDEYNIDSLDMWNQGVGVGQFGQVGVGGVNTAGMGTSGKIGVDFTPGFLQLNNT